ncbi:hypothetical protein PVL29_011326 [Vitis rotundifolia]|uniref:non-specific serine/threonine protein kinase n=1 Tax=Vitis rotundifolia TaxID=103349 RepID=A0AA39DS42_VITRO|nr:hypothetical protein PVL29_011326 [Vitis rotundifolia]
MDVRSFPEGNKNCYTLRPEGSKGNKYLIRAVPTFKLYLGADEWVTVNMENASNTITKEIIHVPKTDDIYVCLVNIGYGTPFISTLELRPLNNSIYDKSKPGSLLLFDRWDFGAEEVDGLLSDVDRVWHTFIKSQWATVKAPYESSSLSDSEYKLPVDVMPWSFSLDLHEDPSQNLYIYMHFAEVQKLGEGDIREFTVSLNEDDSWGGGEPVIPEYMVSSTLHHPSAVSGNTTNQLSFALKMTNRSTLPPLINAIEVYRIKDFSQSSTNQDDVVAVNNIRSLYGLTRHWQGDPCLPLGFPWDGLHCSDSSDSPTIISLDLSYNNLTGTVPEFFADLPLLMVLNLIGNQLTGSVPQTVMERFKHRTLSLMPTKGEEEEQVPCSCSHSHSDCNCDPHPHNCPCNDHPQVQKERSQSEDLTFFCSIFVVISLATSTEMVSARPKEGSLKSGNSEFTFSDVASITNNFSRTIGRGGFGQVYLGTLADGTQVAVKMRSESSMQGPKALRAEAKLLTRVDHKNLVHLIGYCKDGTHGREAADVLNWKRRLQIAVDAAHGLEYLHNGCKPPIVHRDMKSSNILLNETLEAKIADFGMSRDLATESGSLISTVPAGTPGYLDPEFQSTGILNKKRDVYSFGIVLLELITGQPAIKNPGNIHIFGWVSPMIKRGDMRSIVDPRLQGAFNANSAWKALEIALACVALTGMQRPDMSHVLEDLKECLEMEVTSRRIQSVGSHSIGSGNSLDDLPLILGTQSTPRAR